MVLAPRRCPRCCLSFSFLQSLHREDAALHRLLLRARTSGHVSFSAPRSEAGSASYPPSSWSPQWWQTSLLAWRRILLHLPSRGSSTNVNMFEVTKAMDMLRTPYAFHSGYPSPETAERLGCKAIAEPATAEHTARPAT